MDGRRRDAIGRFLARRTAEGRLPGAAWTVLADGEPVARGAVGAATLTPRLEPLSAVTPFDLASLTKPLCTAPLAALLEQDGIWSLDAAAAEFLDELSGTPYAAATLGDLARHRAGLPAWHPLWAEPRVDPALSLDPAAAVRRIAALPPAGPAGEELYSDLGYILLGAALERAAGASLPELFARRLARPAGLRRLGFPGPADRFADAAGTERGNRLERSMAAARGVEPPAAALRWEIRRGEVHDSNAQALGGAAGHAGLFGDAGDTARLAHALAFGSAVGLGQRARSRLLEADRPGAGRTVGFELAAAGRAARGILPDAAPGHLGFTGTSVWIDPARRRVAVLLTNRVHPSPPERDFMPLRRAFHRLAFAPSARRT